MNCLMKEGGGGDISGQEEEKVRETNISEPYSALDTTWVLSHQLLIPLHSSKQSRGWYQDFHFKDGKIKAQRGYVTSQILHSK